MVKRIYFRFFVCKNHNTRAVVPAIDISVAGAFLSNIFLTVFTFLIVNARTTAASMSVWSKIPVFAFSFIKVAKPWQ